MKEDKTYGSREGLHWYYHGDLALLLSGLGRGLQPTCHVGQFTRFFKDPPLPTPSVGISPLLITLVNLSLFQLIS